MQQRGTIKVGRWVYPARLTTEDGRVVRNTKRDGSGEWDVVSLVDRDKFVPDADMEVVETTPPEVPGFTAEGSDYDDLRVAYRHIFDAFATTYPEIAEHVGTTETRAKTMVSMLIDAGLVVTDHINGEAATTIQSMRTYDDYTVKQAMQDFDDAIPANVKIRRTSSHGGKAGAQTRKPGKSTWEVGTTCPQGEHEITDADGDNPVYVMPSGRKQCRKCRRGYRSAGGDSDAA